MVASKSQTKLESEAAGGSGEDVYSVSGENLLEVVLLKMGKPRWDDKGRGAFVSNIELPNEPTLGSVLSSLAPHVLPFILPSGKIPRKTVCEAPVSVWPAA